MGIQSIYMDWNWLKGKYIKRMEGLEWKIRKVVSVQKKCCYNQRKIEVIYIIEMEFKNSGICL